MKIPSRGPLVRARREDHRPKKAADESQPSQRRRADPDENRQAGIRDHFQLPPHATRHPDGKAERRQRLQPGERVGKQHQRDIEHEQPRTEERGNREKQPERCGHAPLTSPVRAVFPARTIRSRSWFHRSCHGAPSPSPRRTVPAGFPGIRHGRGRACLR